MKAIAKSFFTWDEIWKELLMDIGSFFILLYLGSLIGGFPQSVLTFAVITLASPIAVLLRDVVSYAFSNVQPHIKRCFAFAMVVIGSYAAAAISPGIHLITGDFVALGDICLAITETITGNTETITKCAETIFSWAPYASLLVIVGVFFFTPLMISLMDSIMDIIIENPMKLCYLLAGIATFLGIYYISNLVKFLLPLLSICWGIITPWVIIGIGSIASYYLVWDQYFEDSGHHSI